MKPMFTRESFTSYEAYMLKHLSSLLEIPSMYDEATISEENPFGKGIGDALSHMLQLGEVEGFETKNVNGYAGHIEWGEGEELLGILGHVDVVPPGEGWTNDPFRAIIQDGKMYARGAQDDKGPIMAAFMAMKWLRDLGVKPNKRVRFIFGTDEERNWDCMKHYFDKEEMPSFGFTPDATFPVIHAEKGLIDLQISKPLSNENGEAVLKHFSGGERLNMVAQTASATVMWDDVNVPLLIEEYNYNEPCPISVCKEKDAWTITVTGKTAHAMEPDNGENAILSLLSILRNIPFAEPVRETLYWLHESLADSRGNGLDVACKDDLSGPLTLNVGTTSMENDLLTIGLNIRYPVTAAFHEWYGVFDQHVKANGFTSHVLEHLEPIYLAKEDPLVQKLLHVYHKHTGDETGPLAIGGATYARALKKGVAYGALFTHSTHTAHQADEHMDLEDLFQAVIIYAELLYDLITD
ncbi:dipeptidase PepV [Pontibacillus litoralis]|uniref:Diguanylate cyclase n=1 Tax=Pontibacillus litoralis JSM 072002 TaxID=1385512 RepID=A0A0A5GAW6_9BACI|nr:dipeptidase PepV [Pontibacillus litoralis]KGX89169.1 diguanylate cyclase [Pontibacillus litoralis JSM 072002]